MLRLVCLLLWSLAFCIMNLQIKKKFSFTNFKKPFFQVHKTWTVADYAVMPFKSHAWSYFNGSGKREGKLYCFSRQIFQKKELFHCFTYLNKRKFAHQNIFMFFRTVGVQYTTPLNCHISWLVTFARMPIIYSYG